ncbi:MAG: hypothetical protein Q4C42_11825 [Clostridia bacterium]|nr:hypothetical protein [Clostridia bacterium]
MQTVKKSRKMSYMFFSMSPVSLAVGASFHGLRMHPENPAEFRLGVAMGIAMIILSTVFICLGIFCRIKAKKTEK